jgi:hypothetical protein
MAIGGLSTRPVPYSYRPTSGAVLVSGAQRLGRDPRSESSEGAAQDRSHHEEAPARRERHSSAWAAAQAQHVKREMIGVGRGSVRGTRPRASDPLFHQIG